MTASNVGELEGTFFKSLSTHGVTPDAKQKIMCLTAPLRSKSDTHYEHYAHSLRVALFMEGVITAVHMDPKIALFAGALHDVGKAQVPVSTLGKTTGWSARDSKIVSAHVADGYRLVRDCFDFTADVILWHHRFQTDGYPKRIPTLLHDYSLGTKVMIPFYGRMLAICDQWDALHRKNDRNDGNNTYHRALLDSNPDQRVFIQSLFDTGILHESYYET